MKFETSIRHGILLLASFIALVPTIFMISTSLKSQDEYVHDKIGLPDSVVLDHFKSALVDSPFLLWMSNSVILAVGSVLVSTFVSWSGRLCHRAHAVQGTGHAVFD